MATSKVLVPWDTGVKARALRAVMIFSLATAPAATDFNKEFISAQHLYRVILLHVGGGGGGGGGACTS